MLIFISNKWRALQQSHGGFDGLELLLGKSNYGSVCRLHFSLLVVLGGEKQFWRVRLTSMRSYDKYFWKIDHLSAGMKIETTDSVYCFLYSWGNL